MQAHEDLLRGALLHLGELELRQILGAQPQEDGSVGTQTDTLGVRWGRMTGQLGGIILFSHITRTEIAKIPIPKMLCYLLKLWLTGLKMVLV